MPLNLSSLDIYSGAAAGIAGATSFSTTTAATNFLTIPIGKTFVGTIVISCSCTNAGANAVAAQATGIVGIFGAGTAIPAANASLWRCDALAGANVAAGTVGDGGNNTATFTGVVITVPTTSTSAMTLGLASTNAGTNSQVSASAYGVLI